MMSRMDKYNDVNLETKSRVKKNENLYEDVKRSSLDEYDVNSNIQVISSSNVVDISKVKNLLDEKYGDNIPRRKSIIIPEYEDEVIEEEIMDTKEYDINAILNKAKEGKVIDYSKERLKKIRDAQQEILENLDLELKKVEEPIDYKRKKEEENLINLVNTITQIEAVNKKKLNEEVEIVEVEEENTATIITEIKEDIKEDKIEEKENIEEIKETEKEKEDKLEETLTKLNIDIHKYDDFSDISKRDKGSIVLKIFIFIFVIGLIFGAIVILNNLLNLGLF